MAKDNKAIKEAARQSLNQIEFQYEKILRELEQWFIETEDDTGEVPEEFTEKLFINRNELEDKLYNYYKYQKSTEGKMEAIKLEEERLYHRRKRSERSVEFIKATLKAAVEKYGKTSESGNYFLETPAIKMTVVGTKSIEIPDIDKVPGNFTTTTVSFSMKCPTLKRELMIATIMNTAQKHGIEIDLNTDTQARRDDIKAAFKDTPEAALPKWFTYAKGGYLKTS